MKSALLIVSTVMMIIALLDSFPRTQNKEPVRCVSVVRSNATDWYSAQVVFYDRQEKGCAP